jgi:GT2 family glycosyltransferase
MRQLAATIAFVPREQLGTTQRSLETLYERTKDPFELICVDGGSPPSIQRYLEQAACRHQFTLLRTESFLTPNQARNIAAERVRTRYVIFVDNDVLVGQNFLSPLIQCAEETGAWVVGPLYFELEPESNRIHMYGGECRIQEQSDGTRDLVERHRFAHKRLSRPNNFRFDREEIELIEFHTVLVDMEAFRRLGPLDEGLLARPSTPICADGCQAGERVFLEPCPKSRILQATLRRGRDY